MKPLKKIELNLKSYGELVKAVNLSQLGATVV